jgi:diacylglycerol kinase
MDQVETQAHLRLHRLDREITVIYLCFRLWILAVDLITVPLIVAVVVIVVVEAINGI